MTTPNLPQKSTKTNDSSTQDHISLMQWLRFIYGGVSSNKITAIAGENTEGLIFLGICQKLSGH